MTHLLKKYSFSISAGLVYLLVLGGCFGLTDAPSKKTSTISGTLTDSNGNSAEGVLVKLFEVPVDSIDLILWSDSDNLSLDTFTVVTDENGNYNFSDLDPGHYSVVATLIEGEDTLTFASGKLTVKNEDKNIGEDKLQAKGTLEIEILKSGRPLLNIQCVIPELHLSTTTNDEGKCTLITPPGDFEVFYISDIYKIASEDVTVVENQITKITTLTAKYKVDYLSLLLESSDRSSTVEPDTAISVGAEQKTSIKAIPGSGVTFVKWNVIEGDVVFDNETDTETNLLILENAKVEAVFRRNVMLKVVKEGNGSTDPIDSIVLATGNSRTILATPDAGWEFDKWSVVEGIAVFTDEVKNETQVTIFEDALIKATFKKPTVEVLISASEGGSVKPDTLFVEDGGSRPVDAIASDSYVFVNWEVLEGNISFTDDSSASTVVSANSAGKIRANFEKTSGSLIVEHEGNGLTNPDGEVAVKLGVSISITASPDTGWAFKKWTVLSGNIVIEDSTKTDTRATAISNGKIKAIFGKDAVTLTTEVSGMGDVTPSGDTSVSPYTEINLSATPKENWNFNRWVLNQGSADIASDTSSQTTVSLTSDAVIQAQFLPVQVILSIQGVGQGTVNPSSDTLVGKGNAVNISANPSDGWVFHRWQVVEGNAELDSVNKAATQVTLGSESLIRAIFRPRNFVLRVVTEGSGTTNLEDSQLVKGALIIPIESQPNPGWNFEKWEVVSGTANFENEFSGTTNLQVYSNATIKAKFSPTYGLLTMGVSGSGQTTPKDTVTIQMGTPYSISAVEDAGWKFVNWSKVSGLADFDESFNPNTQVTLLEGSEIRANFSNNTTTLHVSNTGEGNTSPANEANVVIGVATEIIANPSPGWKFGRWEVLSGDASIVDVNSSTTNITVNNASSIRAVFEDNRTTLTLTTSGSGSTSPTPSVVVEKGIPTDISALPDLGWTFVTWEFVSGGASLDEMENPNTSATLTSAATIKAVFSQNNVTLNLETGTGGTVSPSQPQVVTPGTQVSITALPESGVYFSHWSVESGAIIIGDSTLSSTDATVNGNGSIKAHFNYELVIAVTGEGGTTPSGVAYYSPGSVVDLSASPSAGWFFENWNITSGTGVVDDPNQSSTKVTMNSSSTLQATFKQNPALLTVTKSGEGMTQPGSDTLVGIGQSVNIGAAPATSWGFSHWELVSGNADIQDSTNPFTSLFVYDTSTIKAVFIDIDTVFVGVASGLGNTTPFGAIYPIISGTSHQITATPSTGWVFKYWARALGNVALEDSTSATTMATVNGNDSVGAVFAKLVTLLLGIEGADKGHASVSPMGIQTLEQGTGQSITAVGGPFHRFVQWKLISGDADIEDKNNPSTNATINDTSLINAVFERFAILTTSQIGTGTVTPSIDTSEIGRSVSISATPFTKWVFWKWKLVYGQGLIQDVKKPNTSVVLQSDSVQVEAQFVRAGDVLTLTLTSSLGGSTIPAQSAYVLKGEPFAIQAVPNALFRFTAWSVTTGFANIANTKSPSTTVILTTSATVHAAFTRGLIIGETGQSLGF